MPDEGKELKAPSMLHLNVGAWGEKSLRLLKYKAAELESIK